MTTPTIRSAIARLIMRRLNGFLRFLLGSMMTARFTRRLPGMFVIMKRIEIVPVNKDNAVGTPVVLPRNLNMFV